MLKETDFPGRGLLLGPGPRCSACPVWLGCARPVSHAALPSGGSGFTQWPDLWKDTGPITPEYILPEERTTWDKLHSIAGSVSCYLGESGVNPMTFLSLEMCQV